MPTINKPKKTQTRTKTEKRVIRQSIYNTRKWKRIRKVQLMMNPLCERCEEKGKITPAEDIHHRTSFMQAKDKLTREYLAYDYSNLMSLCRKCHNELHNGKCGTK